MQASLERAVADVSNRGPGMRQPSNVESTFLTATDVTVDKSVRDTEAMFPDIRVKPLLKRRHLDKDMRTLNHMDPNMLISEQSVTSRYLMRNLYSKGSIPYREKVYQTI